MKKVKKQKISIIKKNDNYEMCRSLITTKNAFKASYEFVIKKDEVANTSLNRVEVNCESIKSTYTTRAIIMNPNTGVFFECMLFFNPSLKKSEMAVKEYLLNKLDLRIGDNAKILIEHENIYNNPISHIDDNASCKDIYISQEDANGLEININKRFSLYKIYNNFTGSTVTVYASQLQIDNTLEKGQIRLSRMQRNFLDLELPYSFDDIMFSALKNRAKQFPEIAKLLSICYDAQGEIDFDKVDYEGVKLKKLLVEYDIFSLSIQPVMESFLLKKRRSICERITRFIVGASSTYLCCVRPYIEDDDNFVVRLSKDNMEILGVQNMDKIRLSYGTNSVVCRVMAFEERKIQRLSETNKKVNINNVIGVPSYIRKQLKIYDLKHTIKVERNTKSMFIKYINKSILSTIISIYGAATLLYNDIWWGVAACLLAIPIIVYFSYGEQRNNRASRR